MSVYFLRAEGRIKIGYSDDVEKRAKQVFRAYPDGEILGSMPGDRALEAHLHRKFADSRLFGEWFEPSDDLMTLIGVVCTGPDLPEPKKAHGSVLLSFEDKFCEDSADCLRAYIVASGDYKSALAAAAEWSGMDIDRLQKIYDGDVTTVTAAEYSICRAMGESAGKPKIEKVEL